MKRIVLTGAVLLSSLISFNVLAAAAPTPEEQAASAVASRQAVFKLLSFSNAPLGGMARGGAYDADAAKLAAERVAMLADMIPALFVFLFLLTIISIGIVHNTFLHNCSVDV